MWLVMWLHDITPSSIRSNDEDHEDPLGSNKLGLPKASIQYPQALLPAPKNLIINQYSQQYLYRNINSFLQVSKGGSCIEDKLKALSPNVYSGKPDMKCYKFCQQCKNYFATARTTKPNQILFAVSFFQD